MTQKLISERIIVPDSAAAVSSIFLEKKWSDGLPIIPPTEAAVAEMLTGTKRAAEDVVAVVPPGWGEATVEKIAINAAMAGCLPEYMPVIMTAVEAMCEEQMNLYGVQATTHPCGLLVIVNGPIAKKLNINSKAGVFGPGWRANATIGRAIRLILMNIGGAFPGDIDMATQGQSCKYTFCIAENEDENPWEPLHVERGFAASVSAVTMSAAENPHNINEHCGVTAEEILITVANTAANTGHNNILSQDGEPIIVLGPEHAATIAGCGFSKKDVKEYIHREARIPRRKFPQKVIDRHFAEMDEDAMIPIAARAEDIMIIVAGGPGKHSAFCPTFGATRPAIRAIAE